MRALRLLQSKKGFTLIELMIATSIMVVLVAATLLMLGASTNLFAEQTDYSYNQQLGDACLDFLKGRLLYADNIALGTAAGDVRSDEAFLYVGDENGAAQYGRLYYKAPGGKAQDVFGVDFYAGKSISARVTVRSGACTIRVDVVEAQEENASLYNNAVTIAPPNGCVFSGVQSRDGRLTLAVHTPG